MSIAHLLDDFGGGAGEGPCILTDVSLEDERLDAFEKGYQAGWDDSLKAQRDDARHIAADLAQNLRDLSFTYEEAYAAVLGATVPVVEQALQAVLPRLAQEMLLPRLSELLLKLARQHGRKPVHIIAAPDDQEALRHLRATMPDIEVLLETDPALASGQVQLSFGEAEHEVDMTEVLQTIDAALAAFFADERKDTA